MYAGFLDLDHPLLWTIDDVLPSEVCARYADRMRTGAAEPGTIAGGRIDLVVRNNTRVMWDDPAEADQLLDYVRPRIPVQLSGRTLVGANPRLRLYRYGPGQRHGAHWDTVVELGDGARTALTLVFYLNEGFSGGDTVFPELRERVVPKAGRALVFQHRVLHEASEVVAGEKLVLRTDVVYR